MERFFCKKILTVLILQAAGLPNIKGILHRVLCSGSEAFEPIERSGDYSINASSGSVEGSKHDVSFLASKGEIKTDGLKRTNQKKFTADQTQYNLLMLP